MADRAQCLARGSPHSSPTSYQKPQTDEVDIGGGGYHEASKSITIPTKLTDGSGPIEPASRQECSDGQPSSRPTSSGSEFDPPWSQESDVVVLSRCEAHPSKDVPDDMHVRLFDRSTIPAPDEPGVYKMAPAKLRKPTTSGTPATRQSEQEPQMLQQNWSSRLENPLSCSTTNRASSSGKFDCSS